MVEQEWKSVNSAKAKQVFYSKGIPLPRDSSDSVLFNDLLVNLDSEARVGRHINDSMQMANRNIAQYVAKWIEGLLILQHRRDGNKARRTVW